MLELKNYKVGCSPAIIGFIISVFIAGVEVLVLGWALRTILADFGVHKSVWICFLICFLALVLSGGMNRVKNKQQS